MKRWIRRILAALIRRFLRDNIMARQHWDMTVAQCKAIRFEAEAKDAWQAHAEMGQSLRERDWRIRELRERLSILGRQVNRQDKPNLP